MTSYRYPDGSLVKIVRGDLVGSTGYVAQYYPKRNVYSLRILPTDCTDSTMQIAPDGYVHWLAEAGELENASPKIRLI